MGNSLSGQTGLHTCPDQVVCGCSFVSRSSPRQETRLPSLYFLYRAGRHTHSAPNRHKHHNPPDFLAFNAFNLMSA
jgi:hypothetical protein